jgi:hypothetical protein
MARRLCHCGERADTQGGAQGPTGKAGPCRDRRENGDGNPDAPLVTSRGW